MKAIFIVYNQAWGDEVISLLDGFGQRGFTRFDGVGGRGTSEGIPHLDSHAWPEYNDAVLTMVEDDSAGQILDAIREKNASSPELGMRAFVWNIENYC